MVLCGGQSGKCTVWSDEVGGVLPVCYAVLAYNMNTYGLEAPAHPTEPALPS